MSSARIVQLLIKVIERLDGRAVVLMTTPQRARWDILCTLNCDLRYGDTRTQKIARVGAIGRETKTAVAARSGGFCEIRGARCGRLAHDIHHTVFRRFGGTNELENLKHVCMACHQGAHAADAGLMRKDRESIGDRLARRIKW